MEVKSEHKREKDKEGEEKKRGEKSEGLREISRQFGGKEKLTRAGEREREKERGS